MSDEQSICYKVSAYFRNFWEKVKYEKIFESEKRKAKVEKIIEKRKRKFYDSTFQLWLRRT